MSGWKYIIQLTTEEDMDKIRELFLSWELVVPYTIIPPGEQTRSIIISEHQKGLIDSQGDIKYRIKTRYVTAD